MRAWEIGVLSGVTSALLTQFALWIPRFVRRVLWSRTPEGQAMARASDRVAEIVGQMFPEKRPAEPDE